MLEQPEYFENKPEIKISNHKELNEKLKIINPEELENRPKLDRKQKRELKSQTATSQNEIREEIINIIQSDKEIKKLYFEAIKGRQMADYGDFLEPRLETLLPIHQKTMEMFDENFEPSVDDYKEALGGVLEIIREDRTKTSQEAFEKELKEHFEQEKKDLLQLKEDISNYIKELDFKKSKDKIFSYLLDKLAIIPQSKIIQESASNLLRCLNFKTFSESCSHPYPYHNSFSLLNGEFNAQKKRLNKINYDSIKEEIYKTIKEGGRIIEFSQNLEMNSPIYNDFKLLFLSIDNEGNIKEDFEEILEVIDDKRNACQKLKGRSLLVDQEAFPNRNCLTKIYLIGKDDVASWREYSSIQTFSNDEPSPWSLRREN